MHFDWSVFPLRYVCVYIYVFIYIYKKPKDLDLNEYKMFTCLERGIRRVGNEFNECEINYSLLCLINLVTYFTKIA